MVLSSKRKRLSALLATIVAIALAFLLFWQFYSSELGKKSLLELLVEVRAEYEAPGFSVEQAAINLQTPQAAFEFVRDRVRYSPYQGNMQAPADVLLTRVGNVQDRALLLFAILQEMGEPVKMFSDNTAPQSRDLPIGISPSSGTIPVERSDAVDEILQIIGYDQELESEEISQIVADLQNYGQETNLQIEQTKNLLDELLDFPSPTFLSAAWVDYDRDWIWPQVGEGEGATIYDPSYPDLDRPQYTWALDPENSSEVATIAPSEISLFVENRIGLREQILAWEGQAYAKDVLLTFFPTQDSINILEGAFKPEQIEMWTPALTVGEQSVFGVPVSVKGNSVGFLTGPAPYAPADGLTNDVEINSARLVRVDTGDFPNIRVLLDVATPKERAWFASDFAIVENQISRPVRVKSVALEVKPVIAVSDVSWSMEDDDRLGQSQIALNALVDNLNPLTPFGLVSFAQYAQTELELTPLGDGSMAKTAIGGLQMRDYTGLLSGIVAALEQFDGTGGTIIMLTDGQDNIGGDVEGVLSRLAEADIKVIAIGLGADPDESLMRQFAQVSGGEYIRFIKGENLSSIYAAFGSSLSGLLAIEYETENVLPNRQSVTPATTALNNQVDSQGAAQIGATAGDNENSSPDLRQISLKISGLENKVLTGEYEAPAIIGPAPRLVLEVTSGPASSRRVVSRTITSLNGPQSAWNLVGLNRIYFDLGAQNPSVIYAGYISNWINALAVELDDNELNTRLGLDPLALSNRTSFEYATTVNGVRELTKSAIDNNLSFSPGPNIYFERNLFSPSAGEVMEVNSFDIMQMWGRGNIALGETSYLESAMELQLGATFAEGMVIGGEDSISPLLENSSGLNLLAPLDPLPQDWPIELKQVANAAASADASWIYSPQIDNIAWRLDVENRDFKSYVQSYSGLAKGASIAQIARQFDQIDKMYAAYSALGSWAGKAGGVVGISPLISAIAAFKREENKLWCYSTIMMGYVSESIDDPDAILNRSPEEAKASAANLCKIDYNPDQFGERAVWAAASAGAKSWGKNRFKDVMKSQGFGLGASIVDAYSNGGKIGSIGNAFLPMTPGFQTLMNDAVF